MAQARVPGIGDSHCGVQGRAVRADQSGGHFVDVVPQGGCASCYSSAHISSDHGGEGREMDVDLV